MLIILPVSAKNLSKKGNQKKISKKILQKIKKAGDSKSNGDADAVVISDYTDIKVEKDGSFVREDYRLIKILTEKGKKQYGEKSKFSYHKRYNKISVEFARIIHSDGTYNEIPKDNIKDQTMGARQKMNIFDENFRELLVQYPSVKVGDCIEFKVKTVSKPLLKNNYSDVFLLQTFTPLKKTVIKISSPIEKPLNYIVKNGKLEFSKIKKGKFIQYIWKGKNIKQLKPELGMESIFDLGLKLVVSTFKEWKQLSAYGAELNIGKIDKNEKMVKTVQNLIKDKKTKKEKILAIFRYISQKVRYMGSSMDVGAFIEPHKATYTFEKQYGVCRDKSILMVAMLKIAGIHAEDVIVNVSHKTDIEVPTIFFEHAVVAVEYEKGKFVYMDPTLEISYDFGEAYLGGKYVLHLVDNGKDLIKTPDFTAEKSMGFVNANSKIDDKGELISDIDLNGLGTYDLLLRQIGKKLPGKMADFLWKKLVQSIGQGTMIIDSKYGNAEDINKQYKINLKIKSPNFLEKLGNYYLMKIPEGKSTADLYFSLVIYNFTRLPERKYPIYMQSAFGSKIVEKIEIPEKYRIKAIPDSFKFVKGPVVLSVKIRKIGNKIFFERVFKINSPYITPKQYQYLREGMLLMDKFNKSFIILKKGENK
jgi:hypothetical protein